jgi:hypothetical protein
MEAGKAKATLAGVADSRHNVNFCLNLTQSTNSIKWFSSGFWGLETLFFHGEFFSC